jgi:type I restriction-modification system DNA methylase subunit
MRKIQKKTDSTPRKKRIPEAQTSEVHAYKHILEELKMKGWDTRNPSERPTGQVWTQNECLAHTEIKSTLGLERPENIVKVTESSLWVIEAKRSHGELEKAVSGAINYAKKINRSKTVKAAFVSGVAGSQESAFLTRTLYLKGGKFRPITMNGKEISGLPSHETLKNVLAYGPDLADIIIDEALFLRKAEKINGILHEGDILASKRASVIASLLLSLTDATAPNIDAEPTILVEDINTRVRVILKKFKKEDFHQHIKIPLPTSTDNHIKFKIALVQTIQELLNLDIRSAMNSHNDVLGKFYEVFLKYGNGAKDIGIVLTPRHITQFAVQTLGVTERDIIFDPTCGTGGFLVAAWDAVRKNASKEVLDIFKDNNLFGIDGAPEVIALAIVNMIFRGDGKNGIVEGNCLHKAVVRTDKGAEIANAPKGAPVVTRVLMNPPFAKKNSKEKEYKFVDYALSQMADGGLLFSVLPYSTMVKPKAYYKWRRDLLLKNNTLLAVVTFPPELFYPVGVHTVGLFLQKGRPHDHDQNVLWIRANKDGLVISKGKRLPSKEEPNLINDITGLVRSFIANPKLAIPNIERFQKSCPIDFSDPLLELIPENYLDQAQPTEEEMKFGIEKVMRDAAAFLVKFGKENIAE